MDCTKQSTMRISMRIQDYEIFTKLHSASFKTGTEKYVSNWKVYNNWVATTSIFNVQAPFFGTRALYFTEHGSVVYY